MPISLRQRNHPTNEELQIELIGDLATLLDFAGDYQPDKTKPGYAEYPGRTKWLVAGVGFVQDPTITRHV